MHDIERERAMPIFIFVSMFLHALLFLYAPQIVTSLFPGFGSGEQGGVTYVTLVDGPIVEPRASTVGPVRPPQATPEPRPRPEPSPAPAPTPSPAPAAAEPTPAPPQPEPRPAPEPEPAPAVTARVEVAPEAARPAEPRPEAVRPSPSEAQHSEPAPGPEAATPAPAPRPEEPRPVEVESAPAETPVLTSERGSTVVAAAPASAASERPTGADAGAARTGEPARVPAEEVGAAAEVRPAAERPSDAGEAGGAPEGGTGASADVSSAAPNAQISSEPALTPRGESMIQDFGGATYPSKAIDVLQRTVTVEVAAIVSPEGRVEEVYLIDASGVSVIDEHALGVARLATRYRPYSETYEIRIYLTFDPARRSLAVRVSDFITVPPSIGTHARPAG